MKLEDFEKNKEAVKEIVELNFKNSSLKRKKRRGMPPGFKESDYVSMELIDIFGEMSKHLKKGNVGKPTDKKKELLELLVKVWKISLNYEVIYCFGEENKIECFLEYYVGEIEDFTTFDETFSPLTEMGYFLTQDDIFSCVLDLTMAYGFTLEDVLEEFKREE